MRARALGGTDDGAEVVRVADLVADHQQRRFVPVPRGLEDILDGGVLPHGGEGDDALMRLRAAHEVQLAAVDLHDHDARGAGGGRDVAQRLVGLALGEVDLVDGGTGAQRLDDRVAALDQPVLRAKSRRFAAAALCTLAAARVSLVFQLMVALRSFFVRHIAVPFGYISTYSTITQRRHNRKRESVQKFTENS